jgi:hypothetical protein
MADALTEHINAADPHSQYLLEADIPAKGDIITRKEDGTLDALPALGAPGYILFNIPNSPHGIIWLPFDAVRASLLRYKGDLITTDGNGNIVIIHAGNPGDVLTPDPAELGGLKWVDIGSIPGSGGLCAWYGPDFRYECASDYMNLVM